MDDTPQHDTVLDVGAEQLGKTYASALIGATRADDSTDTVVEQLKSLAGDVLRAHPNLAAALASPRIGEEEKVRVIDRLMGDQLHPTLLRFLKVMARRDRLGYLPAIAQAADDLRDDMMGRIVASVRTAVPLDDGTRAQIAEKLGSAMNAEVRLKESVDPELIGGMVIRIGDRVYDGSVATRMKRLGRKVQRGFADRLMQSFESFTDTPS